MALLQSCVREMGVGRLACLCLSLDLGIDECEDAGDLMGGNFTVTGPRPANESKGSGHRVVRGRGESRRVLAPA